MNDTKKSDTIPYGLAYQPLQTQLAKQGKYAEMRLSTYLSYRIGVKDWTFSAADIIKQTGLKRCSVYRLCEELVGTGIFIVKKAVRGNATIYNYDKTKLQEYLQGDTALDGLGKIKTPHPSTKQSPTSLPNSQVTRLPNSQVGDCSIDTHPSTKQSPTSLPNSQVTRLPNSQVGDCSIDTPRLPNSHLPVYQTVTINKIYKEEKIKTHKQEVSLCALTSEKQGQAPLVPSALAPSLAPLARVVQDNNITNVDDKLETTKQVSLDDSDYLGKLADVSLSAKAKANLFTNHIKELNNLGYGYMMSDKAVKLVGEYFKDNTDKATNYLTDLLEKATEYKYGLLPHEEGYDAFFNIRRVHNIVYFLDNLEAVFNEVNNISSQIG